MARSMWRGAIQFGLVTIPVRLYLATESRGGLSFNLLHKEAKEGGEVVPCLRRIQMKTHCPEHGEIARADTLRGYEWSKGQYVVIDEADFEAVPLRTVRAIEIEQFVETTTQKSAPIFVKQAYYLEPEPIGRKAFGLLKSVLAESGLQGICKIVLKDREQLSVLDPYQSTMLLSTIYWPDEVRDLGELDIPAAESEPKPAEIAMAKQLVLGDDRRVRAGAIPRRVPRGAAQGHRGQGRRPAGRDARAGGRGARPDRPDGGPGGERRGRPRCPQGRASRGRRGDRGDATRRRGAHPGHAAAKSKAKPKAAAERCRRGRGDQGGHPAATPQVGLSRIGRVADHRRPMTAGPRPAPDQLALELDDLGERDRGTSTGPGDVGRRRCCRAMAPAPFDDEGWFFEPWWPGTAATLVVDAGRVQLVADQLADPLPAFPELRTSADQVRARQAVIPGTLLVLDADGRPDAAGAAPAAGRPRRPRRHGRLHRRGPAGAGRAVARRACRSRLGARACWRWSSTATGSWPAADSTARA